MFFFIHLNQLFLTITTRLAQWDSIPSAINPMSLGRQSRPLKTHTRFRNLLTVIGLKCPVLHLLLFSGLRGLAIKSFQADIAGAPAADQGMAESLSISALNLNLFIE